MSENALAPGQHHVNLSLALRLPSPPPAYGAGGRFGVGDLFSFEGFFGPYHFVQSLALAGFSSLFTCSFYPDIYNHFRDVLHLPTYRLADSDTVFSILYASRGEPSSCMAVSVHYNSNASVG